MKRRDEPGKPAGRRRDTIFHKEFIDDLRWWVETDRRIALKAFDLIEAIERDPFSGTGKPEPLKYLARGAWSRRLTQEHRIVYLVSDDRTRCDRISLKPAMSFLLL